MKKKKKRGFYVKDYSTKYILFYCIFAILVSKHFVQSSNYAAK